MGYRNNAVRSSKYPVGERVDASWIDEGDFVLPQAGAVKIEGSSGELQLGFFMKLFIGLVQKCFISTITQRVT